MTQPLFELTGADGYVTCELAHEHWGRAGAAGLLLVSQREGESVVLLQHRSPEVHLGNTWSIPGGALDWDESPLEGALRETSEEIDTMPSDFVLDQVITADHGGWAYSTVIARCELFTATGSGWETGEEGFQWFTLGELALLPLHPGFAASLSVISPLLLLA